MYIDLENVKKIEMKQQDETFSMAAINISKEGEEPRFQIEYQDIEEDICPVCGEHMTKKHKCGDHIILSKDDVVKNIFGDFNNSGDGRIMIINNEIIVKKK